MDSTSSVTSGVYSLKSTARIQDVKEWLFIIGFIDMLGVSLVIPAMPIFARLLGMSYLEIGLLISVYGALQIFTSPIVGSWSDKQGAKAVLVLSMCFTAVSYSILGIAGLTGNVNIFILGRIIAGLFKHTQTLVETYLSILLPTREALIAVSEFTAVSNMGLIVGPIIGGMVADQDNGFTFVCSAAASIFLINSALVYFVIPSASREETSKKKVENTGVFQSLACIDFSSIWTGLLFRFLVAFSVLLFRDNFGLILKEKYDVGIKTSGYIIAYQAAIGAIAGFAVAPLICYSNLNDLIFFATIVLCVSLVCLMAALHLWLLLIILIPFNFTNSILRVTTLEHLTKSTNPEQIGAILGLAQSCLSFARMLAPICSGMLLNITPDSPALGGAIVAAFASLLHFGLTTEPPIIESTRRRRKHDCETCRRMREYFKAYLD